MRQRRIKVLEQTAVYHCVTRIVGGAFLLEDDKCKEVLRKQIHKVARFCGVDILTYCIMSNHFHVLVRVPLENKGKLSDAQLLNRCEQLYGDDDISMLQWRNRLANPKNREHFRAQLIARMGDVSAFMKELKQRFTIWYNRTHSRYGTLWAERFKSVLVENKLASLIMVAAYIDLNAVRAGMVDDPKDYRFCGYAESLATGAFPKSGLYRVFKSSGYSQEKALSEYRKLLFGVAYKGKVSEGAVIDQQDVRVVMDKQGKLKVGELLRHKVRYFTDGAILGSKIFVMTIYHERAEGFTTRKTDRCTLIPYEGNEELSVFRNLRKNVIS